HGARDDWAPRLVALELYGLGQPEVAGYEPADGRVDQLRVAVSHLRQSSLALEDRGYALAACGADRDQAASASALVEGLGERGDDAPAGRRERVARGERAAVHVQLLAVDRAQRLLQPQALLAEDRVLPGLQRAEHLRREGFMDLVEVEVLKAQAVAPK